MVSHLMQTFGCVFCQCQHVQFLNCLPSVSHLAVKLEGGFKMIFFYVSDVIRERPESGGLDSVLSC